MFKKATLAAMALCLSLSVPAFAEVESEQAQVGNLEMTWPVVHTKTKSRYPDQQGHQDLHG